MERDVASGNHYDHARFYGGGLGRFSSPDQLGGHPEDPQSWNRYAYARNNPMKYVDPDGKSAIAAALPLLGSLPLTPPQMLVLTASTSIATGLWIGQQTVGGMTINEGVTRLFTGLLTLDMKSATKPGAANGPTAGKRFPPAIQDQAAGQATDANGQTKCQNCGVPTGTEAGQIPGQTDHIIPKSQGGDATIDNAQHVCQTCNASAGAREEPSSTGAQKIRRVPPDPEQQ
jgi:RHS repeat-associated protein